MNYEFFALTDTGLVRTNNEDAVTVDEMVGLGVLADGMGGYNAGEVASSMAISHIRAELGRWLSDSGPAASAREVRQAMDTSVQNANLAVFQAAQSNANYAGMGTTLVMAVFQNARLFIGHIGDSRCYRMRQQLVQLSKDHSLLQEQLDAGLITPAQAASSLQRNLVTRALGIDDTVLLEINDVAVEADDLYLFCSDGLNDMVDDASIAEIMGTQASLADKAHQLVNTANARGGRDNITVLLVQAHSARKPGLIARFLHP
jgi:serine/threonine protein phosphatase PrpC